jgi:hypothetical protein
MWFQSEAEMTSAKKNRPIRYKDIDSQREYDFSEIVLFEFEEILHPNRANRVRYPNWRHRDSTILKPLELIPYVHIYLKRIFFMFCNLGEAPKFVIIDSRLSIRLNVLIPEYF